MAREKPAYRPMTPVEQMLAAALGACSFSVGSFDKRFARTLAGEASAPDARISEKQSALLRTMVTRYRRQIRSQDIPESERHLLIKRSTP